LADLGGARQIVTILMEKMGKNSLLRANKTHLLILTIFKKSYFFSHSAKFKNTLCSLKQEKMRFDIIGIICSVV
jgi:hypothetical protein